MNNKNKILLALGIIFAVLIIGVGIFTFYRYKISQQAKISQIETEAGYAKTVQIKQGNYIFLVSVGECERPSLDNSQCNPIKNKIQIKNYDSSDILQEIELQNIDSDFNNYDLYPNLVFEDLNFDGEKDLAIMYKQDSNGLRYFNVYLYNKNSSDFELSKDFSDTISGHMAFSATDFGFSYTGLGNFNADDNVLKVYNKTGSMDTEIDYKITDNVPVKIFRRITEKLDSFTKITEGVQKEGEWVDEVLANIGDGSKFQEIYTNNIYNFQTVYPTNTFYIKGSDTYSGTSIIDTNYDNPKLDSIEGGAYFYVENFGYVDQKEAAEQWQKKLELDGLDNVELQEVKHDQYSYGYIYKLSCPGYNGYTNIYFFPHFGFVFNYESESTANVYKDIEDGIVKYMTPIKTLTKSLNPVTIISPKQGDTLEVGRTYDITWNAEDALETSDVQIQIIVDGGWNQPNDPSYGQESCMGFDSYIKNTGKYSWTIPSECQGLKLGEGNKYSLRIYVDDWATGDSFGEESGYFTIKNSQ